MRIVERRFYRWIVFAGAADGSLIPSREGRQAEIYRSTGWKEGRRNAETQKNADANVEDRNPYGKTEKKRARWGTRQVSWVLRMVVVVAVVILYAGNFLM